MVAEGQGKIKVPVPNPVPIRKAKLKYNSSTGELVYGKYRYKMVYVEGGSFDMGATLEQEEQEAPLYEQEKPVHRVTLSSYRIGQTEVPQWLWKAVMGNNPSKWKGDNLPVESVSWNDCQEFLGKLNNITGMHFLLPTEAQWEYAARGGNCSRGYRYSGSDGLGSVAWYKDNSGGRTHQVRLKGSNELGLYDMSGNVLEWCSDWFGDYPDYSVTDPKGSNAGHVRVFRGGVFSGEPWSCRVAFRYGGLPEEQNRGRGEVGFRLAL